MKYNKTCLDFEKQADQLLSRGMTGDRERIISQLKVVSYYRLSGYFYSFRKPDPNAPQKKLDDFIAGTSFDAVWDRYVFDRQLRLLVLDAIERIEIFIRTQLAFQHGSTHGPFEYATDSSLLPNLNRQDYERFTGDISKQYDDSKETFALHFRDVYGAEHKNLPIWMACELLSFGGTVTLYRGSSKTLQKAVSWSLGIADPVLLSWLFTLNAVRNFCAHHSRLWNRELGIKPLIPRKDIRWKKPVEVKNNRIFSILTICQFCLKEIAPQSHWKSRLSELLKKYPSIPKLDMGFPSDWQKCPIWK